MSSGTFLQRYTHWVMEGFVANPYTQLHSRGFLRFRDFYPGIGVQGKDKGTSINRQ